MSPTMSLPLDNIRVIDLAVPPRSPYRPNLPFASSLGFAIGTLGGIGCRAMWQCTHSIGSTAINGSDPVSIS